MRGAIVLFSQTLVLLIEFGRIVWRAPEVSVLPGIFPGASHFCKAAPALFSRCRRSHDEVAPCDGWKRRRAVGKPKAEGCGFTDSTVR